MAKLNVPPTKSSYLALARQLEFAQEGYDLLEQKRQILTFELMSRLGRARDAERRVAEATGRAFAALSEALLDVGSDAVDRAALAVRLDHDVQIADQGVMGIRIPEVTVQTEAPGAQFGVSGTSAHADVAMRRFVEALRLVGELAELETSVLRLARELKRTQRRTNALSKIFIPDYTETIAYISASLEDRERETLVIMKMVKNRLSASPCVAGYAEQGAGAVEGGEGHG
ncbi:MAG TPA: V-type ATP synthase subunit D [Phycisphaerae bacterium]|nr:V-type ATP synthase subunit D [Phycisphaerae bacterium]